MLNSFFSRCGIFEYTARYDAVIFAVQVVFSVDLAVGADTAFVFLDAVALVKGAEHFS